MKADMVVYDRNRQMALIAELKKKPGTGEWAARWRRNMLAHGEMPDVKFFMIALPDRFYFWKDAGNLPEVVEPAFEIEAEPVLRPYMDESTVSVGEVGRWTFESLVSSWLNSLVRSAPAEQETDVHKEIIRSGLSEALKGGYLEHEVVL